MNNDSKGFFKIKRWVGGKKDRNRKSAIPPKICQECGMTWTDTKESVKIKGEPKWFSMWEYLQDFPTIGCDIETCPKCCKRPRFKYKEIE